MAYLVQIPRSPFWFAMWTGKDGKKRKKTTRVRVVPDFRESGIRETKAQARARAQGIADMFERADRGSVTAEKIRKALYDLLPEHKSLPSIEDYLTAFLTRSASKSTHANDSIAVRLFLTWLGRDSGQLIDWLTRETVTRFVAEQLDRVARSTVKRYTSTLSAAFREAYLNEQISRNPFERITWPTTVEHGKPRREAFSMAELQELIERLPAAWSSMVKCCYYLGGLRLADCALLRWSSFDFEKRIYTLETRKRGVFMRIPLVQPLIEHLQAMPRTSVFVHPDIAAVYKEKDRGKNLSAEFSAYVRAFGIGVMQRPNGGGDRRGMTNKTFHSIRYTVATQLHLMGVDESVAMKTLSHASKEVHNIYVQPLPEQLLDGLEKVANRLNRD